MLLTLFLITIHYHSIIILISYMDKLSFRVVKLPANLQTMVWTLKPEPEHITGILYCSMLFGYLVFIILLKHTYVESIM